MEVFKHILLNIVPKVKYSGFTKETTHETFFWSLHSCYATYGFKIPVTTIELRKMAAKQIKNRSFWLKLKNLDFNHHHHE
jgi:hypothetical protein